MIHKLLLGNQRPVQLGIAIFGSLFGLVLLLGSLQVYLDVRTLLSGDSGIISSHYFVINKRVSLLNTLSISNTDFSEGEIREIKSQPFVEKAGEFKSSLFGVKAFLDEESSAGLPALHTDLFFESLPGGFLDIRPEDWKWEVGDKTIPLVVPADYINLYNFGFAPSQGLPQFSKGMVSMATFSIRISGNGKSEVFSARIAGFSSRINTILVPLDFLEHANAVYGSKKSKAPSRLIISTRDPSSPEMLEFLKANGYETNEENLRSGKLNALLKAVMNICVAVGGVIILLSLLGFVQYSQLIISRSEYEVKTLIHIGYHYSELWKKYTLFHALLFSAILVLAYGGLYFVKSNFESFMNGKGFDVDHGIEGSVYAAGFFTITVLFVINSFSVLLSLRRMAKAGK